MGELYRAQILLEARQHRALMALARREGRSVSDLTREIIARYLDEHEAAQRQSEVQALERARRLRASIQQERGGKLLETDVTALIRRMREERDEQILDHRS